MRKIQKVEVEGEEVVVEAVGEEGGRTISCHSDTREDSKSKLPKILVIL